MDPTHPLRECTSTWLNHAYPSTNLAQPNPAHEPSSPIPNGKTSRSLQRALKTHVLPCPVLPCPVLPNKPNIPMIVPYCDSLPEPGTPRNADSRSRGFPLVCWLVQARGLTFWLVCRWGVGCGDVGVLVTWRWVDGWVKGRGAWGESVRSRMDSLVLLAYCR